MELKRKKDIAERLMMRPLSEGTREQVEDILDDIRREQQYILDDDGHRDFLLEFIEDTDEGCSCNDPSCPLDIGKVPSPVFKTDDWEDELRDWRHSHSGDAEPLVKARSEYRTIRSDVEQAYSKIIALARDDLDENADVDSFSKI